MKAATRLGMSIFEGSYSRYHGASAPECLLFGSKVKQSDHED